MAPTQGQPDSGSAPSPRRSVARNGWVWACSCALALFTTFTLLDAFVIGRVQQVAQAADLSSIVTAQETSKSDQSSSVQATADGGPAQAGQDDDPTAGPDSTSDPSAGESPASSASAESRERKHGGSGHSGKHRKPGAHSPDASESPNANSDAGSADSPGISRSSRNPESSDGSSGATDNSAAAIGSAASATGTQIGAYSDDNLQVSVAKVRAYDTDVYIADVQVSSAEYLKTALAQNAFGRNLKDTTSSMAEQAGAVLAVNGDYYGFRDDGYVLRNGVLYRDSAASGTDALVIYGDGTMAAASQDSTTAEELKAAGAWQVLSFGPTLVNDGAITVTADEEVGQSMSSNPRTAIGMVSPLHYVVVVSDGRTGDNAGLSLYQLAQVLVDNGATFAYNLDGGGSTTMYFKGEVLNNPTSGNRSGERSVSDIVYFG